MVSFRAVVAIFATIILDSVVALGYLLAWFSLTDIASAVVFVLVTTGAGILIWGIFPDISRLLQPNHTFQLLIANNQQDLEEVKPFLSFISKMDSTSRYEDVKMQVLKVTAREERLENCRASVTINDRFSDYLRWDDGNELTTLRPGEHDYLVIWFAYKLEEGKAGHVYLNTGSKLPFSIGKPELPELNLSLTFIADQNYERKFRLVLPLDSWKNLRISHM